MKKIISLLLIITTVFSLAGCGSKDEGTEQPTEAATPTRDLNVYVADDHPEDWSDPEEDYYEDEAYGMSASEIAGFWVAADDYVLVELTEEGTYKFYSITKNFEGQVVYTGNTVDVVGSDGSISTWLTVVDDHLEDISNVVYTKVGLDRVAEILKKIEAAKATPTPEPTAETVGYFKYNKIKKKMPITTVCLLSFLLISGITKA